MVKDIAEPRLAADRHPLPDQVGDIAADGPLRRFQLLGQLRGGDRRVDRRRIWMI